MIPFRGQEMNQQIVLDSSFQPDSNDELTLTTTTTSQTSLLIVCFFALSCFYFVLTMMSTIRLCNFDTPTNQANPSSSKDQN